MKRKFILLLNISLILLNLSVEAAEFSSDFKYFGVNTKASTVRLDTLKSSITVTNKKAMKAQIDAINSKVNSVSENYQDSINNLVNKLLPKEQLNKYNEEKLKIKETNKNKILVNIEIAEKGIVFLNKFLKSQLSQESFKNLTEAQKIAINKDLKNLQNVCNSYSMISEQSKILAKQIKAESSVALELKIDLSEMIKNELKVTKQVKYINKLTKSISDAAIIANISF